MTRQWPPSQLHAFSVYAHHLRAHANGGPAVPMPMPVRYDDWASAMAGLVVDPPPRAPSAALPTPAHAVELSSGPLPLSLGATSATDAMTRTMAQSYMDISERAI